MKTYSLMAALLGTLWVCPAFAAPKTGKPPSGKAAGAKPSSGKPTSGLVVQGRVKASTKPPRPGSVPYKDAVIALHLTGVKATHGKASREIVVFVWGMRNNRWTPAASYRPGQMVTLHLTPWEKAERKYGRYNRFELQDEATFDLDNYWGESSLRDR